MQLRVEGLGFELRHRSGSIVSFCFGHSGLVISTSIAVAVLPSKGIVDDRFFLFWARLLHSISFLVTA